MDEPLAPTRAPAFEPGDLRRLLAGLDRALSRPLVDLRERLDRLARDGGPAINDDQHGHLRSCLGLTDDLLVLTRGFLDLAALTRAPTPARVGSLRLGELVRDLDRRFAPTARERRLAWECRLEGGDAVVATEPASCRRALGELVDNALKATPGGGSVRVVVERSATSWSATVSDDGPGIPPEARSKLFKPLDRLPRDDRPGAPRNGRGLALARALVDRLGGSFELDATETGETVARVRFPVAGPRP